MTSLPNRSRSALVASDMQNGVVSNAYQRDRVIANMGGLLLKARAEDVPVVWFQPCDDESKRGSSAWEYVPELTRLDSEPLVDKNYGDSFEATDLEELLAEAPRRTPGGHRYPDRGMYPIYLARCAGPRPRRHPGLRCAHHPGHAAAGFPVLPEHSIACTNMYWSRAESPGRKCTVSPTAGVDFSAN